MSEDEEPSYPTKFEDAETVEGNIVEWLEDQTTSELASKLDQFHSYQLEWFGVNTDDPNKLALLQGELDARENYTPSMNWDYTNFGEKDEDDTETADGSRTGVWDSGLEILEDFGDLAEHKIGARSLEQYAKKELGIKKNKVIVPEEVRKICVAIQEEVNSDYGSGCEFGVLFKGEWTSEGFKVKPDYVIPEQKASRAHITYTEDLKEYRDEGYIVNIHSHPWAEESSGFSGTDDDHINSHFDMAVLYAGGAETFADAVANVEVEQGVTARISPEVVVEKPDRELPDVDGMENVDTKSRTSTSSNNTRYGRNAYRRYKGRGDVEEDEFEQMGFTNFYY